MAGTMLCFTLVISAAWAVMGTEIAPPKPKELANQKGCYVPEMKQVIPYGSAITPPGLCLRVECEVGVMHYTRCGKIEHIEPNCSIVGTDLSVGFPHCCPKIKCIVTE